MNEAVQRPPHGPLVQAAAVLVALAVLAGCSSAPKKAGGVAVRPGPAPSSERDGPDAKPPPNLAKVPDAEPRIEPIRPGGPNKPYEVLGRDYTPQRGDTPLTERGLASWYGKKFHGRRTASGEVYNMYAMTAAHKTMPIPSYARVRNPANGREVVVRVNDRGPFHPGRVIDLSYTAALKLGVLRGVAPVEVERITHDEIRSGAWRRDGASPAEPPTAVLASAADDAVLALPSGLVARPVATTTAAAPSSASETPTAEADPATPPPGAVASASAPDGRAYTKASRGFWVQLGAFRQRDGAEQFHRRVAEEADWLSPLLAVFSEPSLFRLQAGPYPSRQEALDVVTRVREALKLVPVVIERR